MSHWRTALVLFSLALVPLTAAAAPAGKVVIAQGVDPTTLDIQNQQERRRRTWRAQMFDTLVERDQNLKLVPALAAEMPKLVAPTTWEVKLRRGVKFHNGEEFNAESVKFSLERGEDRPTSCGASSNFRAHRAGGHRGSVHGARADEEAVADVRHDHDLPPGVDVPAEGVRGQGRGAFISKNPIGTGPYKFVRW